MGRRQRLNRFFLSHCKNGAVSLEASFKNSIGLKFLKFSQFCDETSAIKNQLYVKLILWQIFKNNR